MTLNHHKRRRICCLLWGYIHIKLFQNGLRSPRTAPSVEDHYSFKLTDRWLLALYICQASQIALMVKNTPTNAGDVRDTGSIPGSGRSPRGGNGNPFQYSCLENPMDIGAWWAIVHRVTQSQTQLKWFSMHTHRKTIIKTTKTSILGSGVIVILFSYIFQIVFDECILLFKNWSPH